MKKLMQNEWLKLRYNRTVIIFAMVMVGTGILFAAVPMYGYDNLVMWDYGIPGSIKYFGYTGGFIAMFTSAIAAGMFTQEFHTRTLHNALSCGVNRRKYILVKFLAYVITSFLIQFLDMFLSMLVKGILFGWMPPKYIYPNLGVTAIVSVLGNSAAMFAWMGIFALIANLFRNPAAAIFAGVAYYFLESFVLARDIHCYGDPFFVIAEANRFLDARRVLTPEFALLTLPCLLTGIVCFFLTYLVFVKKDMN